ncbi:MAG: hypothetical protein NUW01_05430 [Gemmatimonadaceae bacterium]|nr:hypothetical protein [Gemmatimonadaceae bacterium]
MLLPDRLFTVALIRRTIWLWIGARLMVGMFGLLAGIPIIPTRPGTVIPIILVVASLGGLEIHRRREFLFFANLGVAPAAVLLLGVVTASLLELMLVAANSVLR